MREQSPVRHQEPTPEQGSASPEGSAPEQPPRRERSPLPRRILALGLLSGVAVGIGRLVAGGERTPAAGSHGSGAFPEASGAGSVSPRSGSASGAGPRPSVRSLLSPAPSGAGAPFPSRSGALAVAPELPRGGRQVFPRYRLVGYCGLPGSAALGRLGIGRLDDRVAEIEKLSRQYGGGRRPLPVLELIAVVVQASGGADGLYRERTADDVVAQHLAAARRHRALLLLNIQPGRARFLDEVHAFERWLREPDVGVSLDPEWAVGPGQRPGRVFGSTTGGVVDSVAAYLDELVRAADLPQKVLVVHQLNTRIVTGWSALKRRESVAVIKSVDGIGSPGAKVTTWKRLVHGLPRTLHPGFKLFFDEDRRGGQSLMSPSQVLALRPQPEYVMYE